MTTDWNIPKHLARFDFQDLPNGSTKIRVYPHDTFDSTSEAQASNVPFFQAIVQPLRWAPAFPFSASWLSYAGVDISLVQPPLPQGHGSQDELPGTAKCETIHVLLDDSIYRAQSVFLGLDADSKLYRVQDTPKIGRAHV